MSRAERNAYIRQRGLCINCLGQGHLIAKCLSTKACVKCGKRHHSMLHQGEPDSYKKPYQPETKNAKGHEANANESTEQTETEIKTFFVQNNPREVMVLLATALVSVTSASKQQVLLRALLDQGSQTSFITEAAVQRLELHKEPISATISSLGCTTAGTSRARVQLTLKGRLSTEEIDVTALVLKKLTTVLPPKFIHKGQWNHLQHLTLADPRFCEPGNIDLLLGADVYSKILLEGIQKGPRGSPTAQNTTLGWVVFGEITSDYQSKENKITSLHLKVELDDEIKKFWEIEELNPSRSLTKEERLCEELYQKTIHRTSDGRYMVQLPFKPKEENVRLGKSRNIAIARLLQMERRFRGNPDLHHKYAECMKEYLTLGHMIQAKSKETDHEKSDDSHMWYTCSYLPHHAVFKENSSTTKLRVVFDASKKTESGVALNDILLKGPTIQDDIVSLLMRWKKHKIALTADITKMYRQGN